MSDSKELSQSRFYQGEEAKFPEKMMQKIKSIRESSSKFMLQTYMTTPLCALTGVKNAVQVPVISISFMYLTNGEYRDNIAANLSIRL